MADQDSTTTPAIPNKRRAILLRIAALLLVISLAVFAWWFLSGQWRTSTDNAYVGGNIVAVTPLTGGTVVSIHADTTQAVTEGQLLVQLMSHSFAATSFGSIWLLSFIAASFLWRNTALSSTPILQSSA
ncbi:MAG: hypothetical protein NUV75_07625, partial [Gallionella sp.]|nr:hypothetical protein [Gallionella sp.]